MPPTCTNAARRSKSSSSVVGLIGLGWTRKDTRMWNKCGTFRRVGSDAYHLHDLVEGRSVHRPRRVKIKSFRHCAEQSNEVSRNVVNEVAKALKDYLALERTAEPSQRCKGVLQTIFQVMASQFEIGLGYGA
jgi:hypothetical protein